MSVQAQTYVEWRCVIVDDGSSDQTFEIATEAAAADPRIEVVRQANAGPHLARNTALKRVPRDIEWVALLDSDDVWLETALDDLLAAADTRPDAVGVYGLAEYIDSNGTPIRPGAHPAAQQDRRKPGRLDFVRVELDDDATFDSLVVSGTIWPPAVAILRRDVVERVGFFDPLQRLVEDWDLYLRMSRYGPFVATNKQVALYRQHAANLTKRSHEMAFYYARVRWLTSISEANTSTQRRTARYVWRRLQLRWILWATQALVGAVSRHHWRQAVRATHAVASFSSQLAFGRPRQPSDRTVALTVEFVVPRQNGAGLRDP